MGGTLLALVLAAAAEAAKNMDRSAINAMVKTCEPGIKEAEKKIMGAINGHKEDGWEKDK